MTEGTNEITKIQRSPRKNIFAAGYSDGTIRLWNIETCELICMICSPSGYGM